MDPRLGVDELSCDVDAFAAPNAASKDVTHTQFLRDPINIAARPPIAEAGISRDPNKAAAPRQFGGDTLGHTIREIFLGVRWIYQRWRMEAR